MSGRIQKKIRKVAHKRFTAMIRAIGKLPFRQRLWFALRIIRGTSTKGG